MPEPHESERMDAAQPTSGPSSVRAGEPRAFRPEILELPPLPYDYGALEPHVSRRTMEFHHDKHHRAYVDKTTELVGGTELEGRTLPEIIAAARASGKQQLLNQAGQAWNHNVFWLSMSPAGGGAPSGRLLSMVERDFGGIDGFREAFRKEAVGHFASGWAWLCFQGGRLTVTSFHDGDTPADRQGVTPLITCDVWEHAYYLDYQNRRPAFVDAFLEHLINWDYAASRLPD